MKTEPASTLLIADTSGILCLFSPTDSNHNRALAAVERFSRTPGSIPVPTDVFVETVNIVGKKLGHQRAVAISTTLSREAPYLVVETAVETLEEAFRLFGEQPESVSLTDCIVMATADRFETWEIFGFDEVFRKNGYRVPSETPSGQQAA